MPKRSAKSIANDRHRVLWCTLDVGSLKINVYLVDRSKFPMMSGNVGYFSAEANLILIGWDLAHDLAENVLIHELGHTSLYTSGASLGGDKEHSDETEEILVNLFCSQMYDTLRRNGMLRFPARPVTPYDRKMVAASSRS